VQANASRHAQDVEAIAVAVTGSLIATPDLAIAREQIGEQPEG
jgi:hypothetical protein